MRLLITGADSQVAQSFAVMAQGRDDIKLISYNRAQLDISCTKAVDSVIGRDQPDFVINTAAYTNVDGAESHVQEAVASNQLGPANLALACAEASIPLIHFSTDYVFDGNHSGDYCETDITGPLNVYGASKLAGEQAIQASCSKYLILRSSWIFSPYGNNFVKSMVRLGRSNHDLNVVNDQYGKPTCSTEIARITMEIISRVTNQWGIYHLAQPDAVTWFDFASTIFAEANEQDLELSIQQVTPIPSSGYKTAAKRPNNSILDSTKLERTFNISIKPWRESLMQTIGELKDHG